MFQPIVHQRTADAVVARFQSLIVDGVLAPGSRLPAERQLAQALDVSRPVLRDALIRLEHSGLIVSRAGDGTFVADLVGRVFSEPIAALLRSSERGARDYMEFRLMIEAEMAALAAERATEADIDTLQGIGQAMVDAHKRGDEQAESDLDVELHIAVVEAAHNLVFLHTLRACYQMLATDVFANRKRLYAQRGARHKLLEQHIELINAIASGDPEKARQAAKDHIHFVHNANEQMQMERTREQTATLRRDLRQHSLATQQPTSRGPA